MKKRKAQTMKIVAVLVMIVVQVLVVLVLQIVNDWHVVTSPIYGIRSYMPQRMWILQDQL